jgi:hypothetical protein
MDHHMVPVQAMSGLGPTQIYPVSTVRLGLRSPDYSEAEGGLVFR